MRWSVLLLAFSLWAQEPAPLGIVRGKLVELQEGQPDGELVIQTAEERQYRFTFNLRTYVERERKRISIMSVRQGEQVEILSDLGSSAGTRYARIVHVIDPARLRPRLPSTTGRVRPYRSPTEHLVPRGHLTFAGVIRQLNPDRLVLRTRLDGDKTVLLLPDTRYLESGSMVDAASLSNNLRVFIRAARNLDGDIEAYQVIWGEILDPQR
jgi:hypothetical protein